MLMTSVVLFMFMVMFAFYITNQNTAPRYAFAYVIGGGANENVDETPSKGDNLTFMFGPGGPGPGGPFGGPFGGPHGGPHGDGGFYGTQNGPNSYGGYYGRYYGRMYGHGFAHGRGYGGFMGDPFGYTHGHMMPRGGFGREGYFGSNGPNEIGDPGVGSDGYYGLYHAQEGSFIDKMTGYRRYDGVPPVRLDTRYQMGGTAPTPRDAPAAEHGLLWRILTFPFRMIGELIWRYWT